MRILLVLGLFSLFQCVLRAQVRHSIDVQIGVYHVLDDFSSIITHNPGFGITFAGGYAFSLEENTEFRSGISIISFGTDVPVTRINGHLYKGVYRHSFIGFPVHLRALFGNGRLATYVEGGVTPALYLKSQHDTYFDGTEIPFPDNTRTKSTHRYRLFFDISVGASYRLNSLYSVYAGPCLTFDFIGARYADDEIKRIAGAGAIIGLRRKI